ncbi:hypothetical protein Hanom_Chr15g01409841 [Helianthus anomalus]
MRMKMRAAIAMRKAKRTLIFGGCLRTHVRTTWIGFFVEPFILSFQYDDDESSFLSLRNLPTPRMRVFLVANFRKRFCFSFFFFFLY